MRRLVPLPSCASLLTPLEATLISSITQAPMRGRISSAVNQDRRGRLRRIWQSDSDLQGLHHVLGTRYRPVVWSTIRTAKVPARYPRKPMTRGRPNGKGRDWVGQGFATPFYSAGRLRACCQASGSEWKPVPHQSFPKGPEAICPYGGGSSFPVSRKGSDGMSPARAREGGIHTSQTNAQHHCLLGTYHYNAGAGLASRFFCRSNLKSLEDLFR